MPVENRLDWPADRCAAVAAPAVLPIVQRLADTLTLRTLDAREGPLSYGVTMSPRGDVEAVRLLLAGNMDLELRRDLEDRVFTSLLKQEPSTSPWTVRLNRTASGTWSVERSVYCAPRVAQSPGSSRFNGTARPHGVNAVEVRVSVTESGFGEAVQLPYPVSRDLDAMLRQQAMSLRFLPAMLNGEPVPSTFTYFVTIRRRSPLRR